MAETKLQFGGGWQTAEADVTYSSDYVINIKISNTSENDYDRLHLSQGTLTAGGAKLNVFLCNEPTIGDRFVIFKAPSVDGKFSNPQLMNVGGYFFVLSYDKDEQNNDLVVLTAVTKMFRLEIKGSDTELDAPDKDRITQWDTYNLNVVADPDAGGTISVTQTTFNVCNTITIQAIANSGYRFNEWTQEGGAVFANTASPTTTATMPASDVTLTANFEPEFNCGEDFTFIYNGSEVSYGTISQTYTINGDEVTLCWMDRNLGASQVPATFDDPDGYGDLFQWGRGDDGHQVVNWTGSTTGDVTPTTTTLSTDDDPGHGKFITNNTDPWDWLVTPNDNLWQGVDGINNPCPPGWRVPTEDELDAERLSWGADNQNSDGAYASTLKWPVGGYRPYSDGELEDAGSRGFVWSSSVSDNNASSLTFSTGLGAGATMGTPVRAQGRSVRCVRDIGAH